MLQPKPHGPPSYAGLGNSHRALGQVSGLWTTPLMMKEKLASAAGRDGLAPSLVTDSSLAVPWHATAKTHRRRAAEALGFMVLG
jgi:hypothetical protein